MYTVQQARLNRYKNREGFFWFLKVRLSEFWFGNSDIDPQKGEASSLTEAPVVAIVHKQNQYLIFRTFIRGRNCKREGSKKAGRKEK